MGVLAALLVQAQFSARSLLRTEKARQQKTRLQATATDELFHMLRKLADDEHLQMDDLRESWAQVNERVRPDGISTWVCVSDLNRTFDLNNMELPPSTEERKDPQLIIADLLNLCGEFNYRGLDKRVA